MNSSTPPASCADAEDISRHKLVKCKTLCPISIITNVIQFTVPVRLYTLLVLLDTQSELSFEQFLIMCSTSSRVVMKEICLGTCNSNLFCVHLLAVVTPSRFSQGSLRCNVLNRLKCHVHDG